MGVDGQHQVLAWDRRGHGVEQLHRASGSVAFPKLLPVDAAQLSFVAGLNAIPTNHIIGQVCLGAQLRELIAGDASRVAENVRQEGAGQSALVVRDATLLDFAVRNAVVRKLRICHFLQTNC